MAEFAKVKNKSFFLLALILLAPLSPAWSGAWGPVFAVEIRGGTLAEPLTITDPSVIEELSFWVGPGTNFREFMGPVSLERSIVDWDRGEVAARPAGLAAFEVRFLLEPRNDPPAFLVLYEPDPDGGYVYFPAASSHIVTHGVTDTWRYASARFDERIGGAIAKILESGGQR